MNLKSEIAKRIGVAITLASFWSLYHTIFIILAVLIVLVLVASCIILPFRDRLSRSRWKKLAEASMFDITFTALGLSLVISGSRLLNIQPIWWGVLVMLAGGFFLGAGIADNLELRHRNQRTVVEDKNKIA